MATAWQQRNLQCPVCLARMSQSVSLNCHHFFCKMCVDDMKSNTAYAIDEYECGICQAMTPSDEIADMKLPEGLFVDVIKSTGNQQQCIRCMNQSSVHYCIDCKGIFCQECKDIHESFPFSHSWVANPDEKVDTVNLSIDCSTHSNRAVVLNCKDCNKLVCTLCFEETHEEHRIVSIRKAAKSLIPTVQEHLENLKTLKEINQINLDTVISDAENLKKSYEDMEAEIDERYEEMLRKLKEDKASAKKLLSQYRATQTSDLAKMVTSLQRKSKWQDNIINLTETVLDMKQVTCQLRVLQEDLLNILNTAINEPTEIDRYSKLPFAEFQTNDIDDENILGIVNTSSLLQVTVADLARANFSLSTKNEDGFQCDRMFKIGSELWCTKWKSSSDIHILSLDGVELDKISISEAEQVNAIIICPTGIMLGTSKGVFVMDKRERNQHCLLHCHVTDMSLLGNLVYILDHAASNVSVMSFQCESRTYAKKCEFQLSKEYKHHECDTIQATRTCIYIAQFELGRILRYNSQGDLLDIKLSGDTLGKSLNGPFLCGVDTKGGILIADSHNNRLLGYSPEGSWFNLNTENITTPEWAVCYDKKLIVQFDGTLKIYTLD